MHFGDRFKRILTAALLVLTCGAVFAGSTQSFNFESRQYAGSRDRQYKVYVPDGLSAPAPMVMALHGCQQNHDDVLRDWGLTAAAERYGFILVTPFITSYDGLRNTNCWGFWFDGHRHEGSGEPEDLHQIGREVETRFAIDPARRYITGLSSGAAMAVVAATTHNEYWAAAASASGLPYGEAAASVSLSGRCPGSATFRSVDQVTRDMLGELDDGYVIPLLILHNERDCTVVQPAGRNQRDAHLKVFGTPPHDTPAAARAAQRPCAPVLGEDYGCVHELYTVDGTANTRSVVETVFYNGPIATPDPTDTDHGHYWIGGEEGSNGRWSMRRGPSYPDIAWDFFARHARDGSVPAGAPRIVLNGVDPVRIEVGQAFTDPGATATDPEDGSVPVVADCSGVDTARVGQYTCTYRATDGDGNTTTASRSVIVFEPGPPPGCAEVSAPPAAHVTAGRAFVGGWFNLRALTTGDRRDIGFAWDYWWPVTLYEGAPGQWFATPPTACRNV